MAGNDSRIDLATSAAADDSSGASYSNIFSDFRSDTLISPWASGINHHDYEADASAEQREELERFIDAFGGAGPFDPVNEVMIGGVRVSRRNFGQAINNTIADLQTDIAAARARGDEALVAKLSATLDEYQTASNNVQAGGSVTDIRDELKRNAQGDAVKTDYLKRTENAAVNMQQELTRYSVRENATPPNPAGNAGNAGNDRAWVRDTAEALRSARLVTRDALTTVDTGVRHVNSWWNSDDVVFTRREAGRTLGEIGSFCSTKIGEWTQNGRPRRNIYAEAMGSGTSCSAETAAQIEAEREALRARSRQDDFLGNGIKAGGRFLGRQFQTASDAAADYGRFLLSDDADPAALDTLNATADVVEYTSARLSEAAATTARVSGEVAETSGRLFNEARGAAEGAGRVISRVFERVSPDSDRDDDNKPVRRREATAPAREQTAAAAPAAEKKDDKPADIGTQITRTVDHAAREAAQVANNIGSNISRTVGSWFS